MEDITTKIDGSQLTSNEFNQIVNEIENAVKASDQTLSAADQTQLPKAAAVFTGRHNLVTDSGSANNYVLSVPSPFKPATAYFDGMVITFPPGNVNTGSSVLNYATLGSKSILINGNELIGGELSDLTTVRYSASLDAFQLTHVRGRLIIGGNIVNVDGYKLQAGKYHGDLFDISTQSNNPTGIWLKPDGLKMYVVDSNDSRVYQYSLTTPWVLSSAVYDSINLDTFAQFSQGSSIHFKPDGMELYLSTLSSGILYQYTLSTAWDLSTASFTNSENLVENVLIWGVALKSDGAKVYVVDNTSTIRQYTLSTPWDITTSSYDSVFLDVSTEDSIMLEVIFNNDGTKLFAIGSQNSKVYQYTLSTAWDLSTASYDNISLSIAEAGPITSHGGYFRSDGQFLYLSNTEGSDTIVKFSTNILY